MWAAVPLLVSLSTFATHVLLGKDLDIANVLTALALFDILRVPVCMLPQVINSIVIANLSFDRIQRFLLCKEHYPVDEGSFDDVGVIVEDASFIFDCDEEDQSFQQSDIKTKGKDVGSNPITSVQNHAQIDENEDFCDAISFPCNVFTLRHINFHCGRGDLIAVVGSVGQGKSAFLTSLLGEMQRISGTVKINGKIAYCPQVPFIMNDTLQNNVLFSTRNDPIDIDRYNKALSACDLVHDINLLKNGDQTYIGERGFTCSGGQKTRIALARCLYNDADIYILDDPLASVDAKVGRHIFQRCIIDDLLLNKNAHLRSGKKRIVILVTHSVQYLSHPNVTKIVVLDKGHIVEVGSYSQFCMNPKPQFKPFLSSEEVDSLSNLLSCGQQEASNFVNSKSVPCENGASLIEKLTLTSAPSELISDEGVIDKHSSALMTSEAHEREKGHVGLKIYLAWGKAAGGIFVATLFFTGYVTDESIKILSKWWLTYWSRNDNHTNYWFLKIFACINGCALVTMTIRVVIVYLSGIRASSRLFKELLEAILKCPMIFFETTPTGRIINRFSKDVFILDEKLIVTIRTYFATISTCIGEFLEAYIKSILILPHKYCTVFRHNSYYFNYYSSLCSLCDPDDCVLRPAASILH
jgi:ABC-type multidrug transport system fused ATPase/permease subunit